MYGSFPDGLFGFGLPFGSWQYKAEFAGKHRMRAFRPSDAAFSLVPVATATQGQG